MNIKRMLLTCGLVFFSAWFGHLLTAALQDQSFIRAVGAGLCAAGWFITGEALSQRGISS